MPVDCVRRSAITLQDDFNEPDDAILFPKPRPDIVIAFTQDGHMHIFEEEGIVSISELREKVL